MLNKNNFSLHSLRFVYASERPGSSSSDELPGALSDADKKKNDRFKEALQSISSQPEALRQSIISGKFTTVEDATSAAQNAIHETLLSTYRFLAGEKQSVAEMKRSPQSQKYVSELHRIRREALATIRLNQEHYLALLDTIKLTAEVNLGIAMREPKLTELKKLREAGKETKNNQEAVDTLLSYRKEIEARYEQLNTRRTVELFAKADAQPEHANLLNNLARQLVEVGEDTLYFSGNRRLVKARKGEIKMAKENITVSGKKAEVAPQVATNEPEKAQAIAFDLQAEQQKAAAEQASNQEAEKIRREWEKEEAEQQKAAVAAPVATNEPALAVDIDMDAYLAEQEAARQAAQDKKVAKPEEDLSKTLPTPRELVTRYAQPLNFAQTMPQSQGRFKVKIGDSNYSVVSDGGGGFYSEDLQKSFTTDMRLMAALRTEAGKDMLARKRQEAKSQPETVASSKEAKKPDQA